MPSTHRHCIQLLLAGALTALLAGCLAPAQEQAGAPHVVMPPATVVARMDAAVVAVPSIPADVVMPAAVGAGGIVRTTVTPPVRRRTAVVPVALALSVAPGAAS